MIIFKTLDCVIANDRNDNSVESGFKMPKCCFSTHCSWSRF